MSDRTCTICGQVYKYPNQLKRHNNTISCYVSSPIIQEPVIEENPAKQYNCKLCEFTTIHRSSYSRHKKTCSKKNQNLVEVVVPELPITPSITKVMEDLRQQIINLTNIVTNQQLQLQQQQSMVIHTDMIQHNTIQGDVIQGDKIQGDVIKGDVIQNNTYFLTNPFGNESISHISIDKLPTIFNNVDAITEKLCFIMYENPENMNYFKVNITRPEVSILSTDLKVKSVQEDRFIRDFFINIIFKYFIRILNEYKNQLSIEDFSTYMKNAIIYEKTAKNIDEDYYLNNPDDKMHIEIIKNYINDFSRNKDVQERIKDTISLITHEQDAKTSLLKKIDKQHITKVLTEYSTKDKTLSIEEREDERNLYHYKSKLQLSLLKEYNPGKLFN
jgi:hypothetical protein